MAVTRSSNILNNAAISGSTIDSTVIGETTPAAITATALAANTSMTYGASGIPIYRSMINNSGGTLAAGDVVILDSSVAGGTSVKTTTTTDDPEGFGVVTTGGANAASVIVCVSGNGGDVMKVDGTDDIAVGDPMSCFTTAKIGQKGAWVTGGIIAIALEAYTTNDSNGVIKVWLV